MLRRSASPIAFLDVVQRNGGVVDAGRQRVAQAVRAQQPTSPTAHLSIVRKSIRKPIASARRFI
jgi:hypothetical protein